MSSSTEVRRSRACTQYRSMWSVCSRRRLASIEATIFLRWLPALFGSPGSVWLVNLVASTKRSRGPLRSSPRMVSDVPLVETSALSMTLPPASANRSSILALTSGDAPQPQSSPKVMVPSATSEIRTPDLPKSLYRMRFPHSLWIGDRPAANVSAGSRDVRVPVDRATGRVPQDWPARPTLDLVDVKRESREFLASRRA